MIEMGSISPTAKALFIISLIISKQIKATYLRGDVFIIKFLDRLLLKETDWTKRL